MNLRLLKDIPKNELLDKKILFRVDFEVPIKNGQVEEGFRIKATLPTFEYLLSAGTKILILTKRGHPKTFRDPELSVGLLIPYLEKLLKIKIGLIKEFSELEIFRQSKNGSIFIFENLRFWPEEEASDEKFAQKLAEAGDLYISDNFGTAHRAHASVAILPKLLPSHAGFLLEKEVESLEKIMNGAQKPVVAILGGAKLETKLPLIERFLKNGSSVLVAGKLANTILIAKGLKMSESCADTESFQYIKDLDLNSSGLHWPVDGVVAKDLNSKERWTSLEEISPLNTLAADECVLDMGPATVGGFTAILRSAKTIFWNGPVGVCEDERFAKGTMELARSISRISAFKVLGGG
ncbi:MAG: phosphoglycerate kinase, partial [bacterium]|nr:phosphoglycerate kinase [bacterium]